MPGLEQLRSGKWRFTVQRGRRYADTRNTRQAAREFALNLEDLIDNGHVVDWPKGTHPATNPPPGKVACCVPPAPSRAETTTFGTWRELWWEAVGPTRELSTIAKTESYVRNHVARRWDDDILAAITRSEVQKWVNHLRRDRHLAVSTVLAVHAVLVEIITAAVNEGILTSNPARGVILPKDDADEVLTLDDMAQFVRLLSLFPAPVHLDSDGDDSGLLTLVGGVGGPRWSELLGLRVDDWTGSSLAILPPTRTVCRGPLVEVRGVFVHKAPKSAAGERLVLMPPFVRPPLDAQAERRANEPACALCGRPHLFAAPMGGPWRRSNFTRRIWAPRASQIRPGLTFKGATRHFHETLMEKWVPEPIRRRRLGHAIPGMGGVYGHETPDAQVIVTDGLTERWDKAVATRTGWWTS